jgi:hypothetical protein
MVSDNCGRGVSPQDVVRANGDGDGVGEGKDCLPLPAFPPSQSQNSWQWLGWKQFNLEGRGYPGANNVVTVSTLLL